VHCFRLWIVASLLLLPACGKKTTDAKDTPPAAGTVVANAVVDPCGIGLDVGPETAVAVIDGVSVPCSELYQHTASAALSADAEYREQLHNIHKQGLSELINEKLLKAAADEKKLTVKDLVASSLSIVPTTVEEAKAFYAQAVARGEKLPPYEEVEKELNNYLNEQKQRGALETYRQSLQAKAEIDYRLPLLLPPKFEVNSDGGSSKGPSSAPVTIVEFSDYQCPFCGRAEPTIERLLAEYGDKIRLVYRDYPLPNHSFAPKAAEATLCAGKQGRYWEMHDLLFKNQRALDIPDLIGYAATLKLKSEDFLSCLQSGETRPSVVASTKAGEDVGVNGTPAFFVNGRLLSGAQPYERFKEIIEYELKSVAK